MKLVLMQFTKVKTLFEKRIEVTEIKEILSQSINKLPERKDGCFFILFRRINLKRDKCNYESI